MVAPFIMIVLLILGGYYLSKMNNDLAAAQKEVAASNAKVAEQLTSLTNMTLSVYAQLPDRNTPVPLPKVT
jgi:hypothetical protein